MKTTEEMVAVMQAFMEGKKIEWFDDLLCEWKDTISPAWDWLGTDYRVKPEVKYRPYKDTEEMLDDFCERFKAKRTGYEGPSIWIVSKCTGVKYLITAISEQYIWTMSSDDSMTGLFTAYTYKDGSPCGKEVEE